MLLSKNKRKRLNIVYTMTIANYDKYGVVVVNISFSKNKFRRYKLKLLYVVPKKTI